MSRLPVVVVPATSDAPYFLRLARGVASDIRRGRLRRGDPLPGTRALAASLGVNRNTVVAAYRELALEGWVDVRQGGGTFVADDLPEVHPRSFAKGLAADTIARTPGFRLAAEQVPARIPTPLPAGVLSLAGGVPDVRLLPTALLARAYRGVLRSRDAPALLSYGDPRGDARLREAIAAMARAERGVPADADNVLVTRGSQMAIELVARAVVPRGGVVAVEAIGYRPAWAAFDRAGASVVPVPVDAQGVVVDAVAKLADSGLSLLYVTPHHHYPTTVTLSPGRRAALLALARTRGFAILEDDYDHELHYEGHPILPLASADSRGSVIYVGTLSKVLAPGLRLGYLIAPAPAIERLARERFVIDRQGDHVLERAAAELLADGAVGRHVRKARRVYESRRDALVEALQKTFGDRLDVQAPPGGMAIWARVHAPPSDVTRWEERALTHGVSFAAGQRFTFDARPLPFARFGFALLTDRDLKTAVTRLERAFRPA